VIADRVQVQVPSLNRCSRFSQKKKRKRKEKEEKKKRKKEERKLTESQRLSMWSQFDHAKAPRSRLGQKIEAGRILALPNTRNRQGTWRRKKKERNKNKKTNRCDCSGEYPRHLSEGLARVDEEVRWGKTASKARNSRQIADDE